MFARLHTIDVTREQHEVGLRIVRDEFLPWARESSGFRGLIGLVDETREKALVLTLWSDRAALDKSAEAGDELSRLASGGRRIDETIARELRGDAVRRAALTSDSDRHRTRPLRCDARRACREVHHHAPPQMQAVTRALADVG